MLNAIRKRRAVRQVGFWWHSIDLGDGVVTPGFKSPELLAAELEAVDMPKELGGRSVLDVGGWDGFYAFEAERRGAERVVIVDHPIWATDTAAWFAYAGDRRRPGDPTPDPKLLDIWDPVGLPGRRGFDLAHRILASSVEPVVVDLETSELERLGTFDVVLYLGVLYHMENPMHALRQLSAVTHGMAIIETEAVVLPDWEHEAIWRFFPGAELNNDPSNWWAPNLSALGGALNAAGFQRVDVKVGPPTAPGDGGPQHYRAIVHAFKEGHETVSAA
jgi:tRNA (mo5U34)-methyltransferase